MLYLQTAGKAREQKKLLSSLKTETGFDVICSCCLQFKLKSYCKLVSHIQECNIQDYLLSNCSLLQNRSEGQYVCNLCLQDIKKTRLQEEVELAR